MVAHQGTVELNSYLLLPDKPMQMNQALFMAGGHCGYVLQPSTMREEAFDPFDKSSLRGLEPCGICIEVGRLPPLRSFISPRV